MGHVHGSWTGKVLNTARRRSNRRIDVHTNVVKMYYIQAMRLKIDFNWPITTYFKPSLCGIELYSNLF